MVDQILDYSQNRKEPEKVVDLDKIYSTSSSDFSAEDFLEQSLTKEIEILEEQLEDSKNELAERQQLHEEQIRDLKESIQKLRGSLSNGRALGKLAKGDNLQEQRADANEKINEMKEQLREENRDNWRDKSKLKKEIRGIKSEIQKLRKRKYFMEFYNDIL